MNFSSALTRVGSAGALVAVIAAPCCFPLFAAIGTTIGLGALAPYEGIILTVFQGFGLLTLIGLALSFSLHHNSGPVVLGSLACGILAYHFYWKFSLAALYSGLFGLVTATLWNYFATRNRRPILQSTITCPQCGHRKEETMPISACLFFFDCPACQVRLKPRPGDCCVFCSYGSVPCPPIQTGQACCA